MKSFLFYHATSQASVVIITIALMLFVGYLMNLKYIVESGSMDLGGRKKKLAIEAILGLNLYEFERKPKTQQEIIFLELKNINMRKIYNLFPHKPRNVRLKFPSYLKY